MLKYADVQRDLLKPVCRWDRCPIAGIVRSLPNQDCGRNISKHVRWWVWIWSTLGHYLNKRSILHKQHPQTTLVGGIFLLNIFVMIIFLNQNVNRWLKFMSKNTVIVTLLNCHKCAWASHTKLIFLTFDQIDFATSAYYQKLFWKLTLLVVTIWL